jgi:hypothetical protein
MSALLREIGHYDVRFLELKIDVLDRGNESVRVQHTILERFGDTELVTRIDPIILQAEFAATPEDFLDVDGIRSPSNLQHLNWSWLIRSRYGNHERTTDVEVEAAVKQEACRPARLVGESRGPGQADQPHSP